MTDPAINDPLLLEPGVADSAESDAEAVGDVDENQSAFVGLAATGLAVLGALLIYTVLVPAGWLAAVGVVLVAVGVFAGTRGSVGVGVGLLAVASLVATSNDALGLTLAVNAAIAVLCMAVLLVADLSFAMRRATVVSRATVQGLFAVHSAATMLGVVLSVGLVAAVLAVSWPGWLLLLPAVVLGAASIVLARESTRYNRKLRTVPERPGARRMPPPPPVGIRSTMPPPPAPGARPTQQVPPPAGTRSTMPPPPPGARPTQQVSSPPPAPNQHPPH